MHECFTGFTASVILLAFLRIRAWERFPQVTRNLVALEAIVPPSVSLSFEGSFRYTWVEENMTPKHVPPCLPAACFEAKWLRSKSAPDIQAGDMCTCVKTQTFYCRPAPIVFQGKSTNPCLDETSETKQFIDNSALSSHIKLFNLNTRSPHRQLLAPRCPRLWPL